MKVLLLLALVLGLWDGVPQSEREAALPILDDARVTLQRHFVTLGYEPEPGDRWPLTVEKLRAGRVATWELWKRELQDKPQVLLPYRLPARDRLLDSPLGRTLFTESRTVEHAGPVVRFPEPGYVGQEFLILDSDLEDLLGTELCFGLDGTSDSWFSWMGEELSKAGAPHVAEKLQLLQPLAQHWFQREVEVYQLLNALLLP